MPTARSGLAVGVVNGRLYAIGGFNGGSVLGAVEAYDPSANAWTRKAAMPTPRANLAVAVANGILYAMGGTMSIDSINGLTVVEAYDPAANRWHRAASLPKGLDGPSAGVIDGMIYIAGGFYVSGGGGWCTGCTSTLPFVYAFIPSANTWWAMTSMPTPRAALGGGVVGGKFYTIGGSAGQTGFQYDRTEAFTP